MVSYSGKKISFTFHFFSLLFRAKVVTGVEKEVLIRAYKFTNTFHFTDDLCTMNDNGKFENCSAKTFQSKSEFKEEDFSWDSAVFLDLKINIFDGNFSIES